MIQEIETADEALAYIEAKRALGMAPVMRGTSFYRHSFSVSQFGSYLYYLDARGTKGACQPCNLLRTFDFVPLGLPVPGTLPDLVIDRAPEVRGRTGMATTFVPGRREPTLLEAAEAALRLMPIGAERDDLERAIASERRIH